MISGRATSTPALYTDGIGLLMLIAAAMGKVLAAPQAPSLPEDYELEEEEPSDDDVGKSAA
jgi:hypothetical protein